MNNSGGKHGKKKVRSLHHVHGFDTENDLIVYAVFDIVVKLDCGHLAIVFSAYTLTMRVENVEQRLFKNLDLEVGHSQVALVTMVNKHGLGQIPECVVLVGWRFVFRRRTAVTR